MLYVGTYYKDIREVMMKKSIKNKVFVYGQKGKNINIFPSSVSIKIKQHNYIQLLKKKNP